MLNMDFGQQIEETLVDNAASSYDVIMESPIYAMERKALQRSGGSAGDKMVSSINSTLEDTTPSDSGIQMLDSESSELMIESITSQTALDFDDSKLGTQDKEADSQQITDTLAKQPMEMDTNSNVTAAIALDDVMIASNCSTFDTENIVYRRKVRKSQIVTKAVPKKRVSFHEDILKNTRTDNIHIEHGFITYKNGRKMMQQVGVPGRYSWCSEGDGAAAANAAELCINHVEGEPNSQRRRVVYRNACSDVLDYGNSDAFDTNESANCLKYDNSGVFEYIAQQNAEVHAAQADQEEILYKCSCSSSNSSLDSDENDKNSNRQQYGQAKSSSCDCIGMSNANNNLIGENCYFSEPNIDNLNDSHKKSVWNKEKKPKSSCLKKTKRHTNVIQEQDITTKVKKFNVHNMNQLIDNSSKMIFGSLKSIFTMPLPERGVPEGSEDLQAVIECVPELEQTPEHKVLQQTSQKPQYSDVTTASPSSPTLKAKPFLSKSLDGSNNKQQNTAKQFVHNVDEQLRRKNEEELFAPTRQNSEELEQQKLLQQQQQQLETEQRALEVKLASTVIVDNYQQQFRNKFIINCESTVFEHTGVSYCYESNPLNNFNNHGDDGKVDVASTIERETLIAKPEPDHMSGAFMSVPIKQTFSNFFRSFKESSSSTPQVDNFKTNSASVGSTFAHSIKKSAKERQKAEELKATNNLLAALKTNKTKETPSTSDTQPVNSLKNMSSATSSSTISELMSSSTNSMPAKSTAANGTNTTSTHYLDKPSRHLPSPLKKRQLGVVGGYANLLQTTTMPARYDHLNSNRMSPDLFNAYAGARGGSGRDSKSTILSEEFDDILTITTDTDKNESDIVIVDYPELNDRNSAADYANLLKPPQTKTSLINRFLRNVTQKKILETSIRKNNFFANKLKNEHKLFANNLYVPGAKPANFELIDDLNAEIAMEIEMSGANSPRKELANIQSDLPGDVSRFELGIGEISIDIFNGNCLHILRDPTEQLMKVFKLYTGYSREGYMTPVLVLLTDKTLYVTDLVRSRLCSKFVLAYAELDVILMGPYGNTVLLSNSTRDMQQVLLAGGPYPADGLVANLELCARRSGSSLPAVGQLTLEHLAPLQAFVRENSSVTKDDNWVYYAVVNVPSSGTIGSEQEPLGPHIKGFLMHRRVKENASGNSKQHWSPGYFLLKAGVLYMFNDSTQRLPSWAMALAECQGARRAVKAGRPHCFEILLKGQLLQLAAPDEYVSSEWLQALLQSASGLFEMQEKHKTLGCTLVVTQHHLITLREDFSAPLRVLSNTSENAISHEELSFKETLENKVNEDNQSMISSTMSTPTRGSGTLRSCASLNSTPTKLSQLSRRTSVTPQTIHSKQAKEDAKANNTGMSSVYGKNSGVEILTSADIKEMTGIKIPSHNDTWWCILEFSCQEVRECSDDLVLFFASSSEMQRFLRLLEQLWQAKNNDLFPITVLDEDDVIAEQCTMLYMDINRSWEPLLSAALGYPL